jgi:hypothetical protein
MGFKKLLAHFYVLGTVEPGYFFNWVQSPPCGGNLEMTNISVTIIPTIIFFVFDDIITPFKFENKLW